MTPAETSHDKTAQPTFVPHLIPLRAYYGVFAALLALTFITVTVYRIELGEKLAAMGVIDHAHAHMFNMVVSMIIATVKATMVAAIFMHLFFDNKLYALTFMGSLVFLGVFIVFTMMDTMRRGDLDASLEHPIHDKAIIYDHLHMGAPEGVHEVGGKEHEGTVAPGTAEYVPAATPHY